MKNILFFVCFLFVSSAGLACITLSEDGLDAGMVKLSGYVITEHEWGPPNFGENPKTDSTFTATLIKLDQPLIFCSSKDANFYELKAIDCVQIADDGSFPVSKLVGQYVTTDLVDLNVAETYGQVTPVFIDNKNINIINNLKLSKQKLLELNNYHCQSTKWAGGRVE
jgi:hypothetical protein